MRGSSQSFMIFSVEIVASMNRTTDIDFSLLVTLDPFQIPFATATPVVLLVI